MVGLHIKVMLKEIIIRRAHAGDRSFIISLARRFAEFPLPSWREAVQIREGTSRVLEAAIYSEEEAIAVLMAEDSEGRKLGFVHLQTHTDFFTGEAYGHVSELAVIEEAEGRGAGSMLMSAAEQWAKEKGYRQLSLNVFTENEKARRMYERLGYEPEVIRYVKPL
jgi:ribosomal protein S18 acetylase RimI-like enzyme